MQLTTGRSTSKIGLIDGPVATSHPDLVRENLREIAGAKGAACTTTDSMACLHGTFIAGILSAKRESIAPAICPGCLLLIRPVFSEKTTGGERMPATTPDELAVAINDCMDAGACVINLSLALARPSTKGERALGEALNRAAAQSVIVVAAAGNQGAVGCSVITGHRWVIPVVASDRRGRPLSGSNLGSSIGRRGLTAPGDAVTSLSGQGQPVTLGGTSVAAPFVTGTIALLWSVFSGATASQIKLAVSQMFTMRRASIVPPLLNAATA